MASLSKRLSLIADMAGVNPDSTIADIGCDHGFLSIELLKRNAAKSVICADVNEGPLGKAKENFAIAGLSEKAAFILSNGFEKIEDGTADIAVIAGMGGLLIADIINSSFEKVKKYKKLILSPQSDIPEVRKFLKEKDFFVSEERIVYDMGKFYTVMVVNPLSKSEDLTETELFFGKHLILNKDEVFFDYLNHRVRVLESIISGIKSDEKNALSNADRLLELTDELQKTKEILKQHGQDKN
ncbi:MAG: class I SAM-dependent methyltransferase [Lachnospiraceae bacterium]|nr:class I SAM-dependent methyltransferase [Lachnospiraceae bacterium]